jgi:hypothetical protein
MRTASVSIRVHLWFQILVLAAWFLVMVVGCKQPALRRAAIPRFVQRLGRKIF